MLYINFSAAINDKTAQSLINFLSQRVNAGENKFYFLFASPGGQVRAGVTLYNQLKALPARIIMHNTGIVDSIGNVVFLVGEERYANVNSSFLFHGVGFDVKTARFEEKDIKEKLVSIQRDQSLIAQIVAERTNITQEQVRKMFLEAETKMPKEAKELGIIKEIKEAKIPDGSQIASFKTQ